MVNDMAYAMSYLHNCEPPIIHRDLKSLNLLLSEEVRSPNDPVFLKVTDFGLARNYSESDFMTMGAGTQHWMAPEILSSKQYSLKADVYSFAIVVYEIIARAIPFVEILNKSQFEFIQLIISGYRPNLKIIPQDCPDFLKQTMQICWNADPQKRPNFDQIVDFLEKKTEEYYNKVQKA